MSVDVQAVDCFIDEVCNIHSGARVAQNRLLNHYNVWAKQNGLQGIGPTHLAKQLEERGIKEQKLHSIWYYKNIEIKENPKDIMQVLI